MTATIHTVADIHANPALFGADLAQPDLTVPQRFFLAVEGTQLFPGNAAATDNLDNWFASAQQLNGFGDPGVQSIVTTLQPSDVGALLLSVNVAGGGTPGHVTSALYPRARRRAGADRLQWRRHRVPAGPRLDSGRRSCAAGFPRMKTRPTTTPLQPPPRVTADWSLATQRILQTVLAQATPVSKDRAP